METVDFYCERVVAGFGGEPVNALTALAFSCVGFWRLRGAQDSADTHVALALILLGLTACAHHLFALRLTLRADIVANILFLGALGALLMRRLAGVGVYAIFPAIAVVYGLSELLGLPEIRRVFGIWADMFVLLTLILFVIAATQVRAAPDSARGLIIGATILMAGLPFRFLDHTLCPVLPIGTHGIWHLINAASIAVVLATLTCHDDLSKRAT